MPTKQNLSADEIAAAIRTGSTEYTAADLAAARAVEEFEQLQAEARGRAEHDQREQQRNADIEKLKADIAQVDDATAAQVAAVTTATQAISELLTALRSRAEVISTLGQRARELGVPELQNDSAGFAGVGWRRDPSSRAVTRLRVDDRVIEAVDPAAALRRFGTELFSANRINPDGKTPHIPLIDMLAGQDHQITPPATVRVQLGQAWMGYHPGDLVNVDQPTGRWLVDRQGATWA